MMKLTQRQLRQIIKEEASKSRRLAESPLSDDSPADQVADGVLEAFLQWFSERGADLLAGNAFQVLIGTVPDEELLVPVRYEDLDVLADDAAEIVLSDEALKQHVTDICRQVLSSLMKPV